MLNKSGVVNAAVQTWQRRRIESAYLRLIEELSKLLDAGLPLDEAVQYLSGKRTSQAEKLLLTAATEALRKGEFIAELWRPLLSSLAVTVLETGERAGRLPAVMKVWAAERRSHLEWIEKVVKVSAYPALLLVGNLAVQMIVAWIVIPEFHTMYVTVHVGLSPSSRRLMAIVQALPIVELSVVAAVMSAVILILRVRKRKPKLWVRIRRAVPGRRLVWAHRTQRFCTLLGLLLDSGLPVLDALTELNNCQGPDWISEQCSTIRLRLLAGDTLSHAFATELDPLLCTALNVADKTGELAAAVNQTGSYLRKNLLQSMDAVVQWIEPVLIVVLGSIVTITMYILFVPMYQLVSSISMGLPAH